MGRDCDVNLNFTNSCAAFLPSLVQKWRQSGQIRGHIVIYSKLLRCLSLLHLGASSCAVISGVISGACDRSGLFGRYLVGWYSPQADGFQGSPALIKQKGHPVRVPFYNDLIWACQQL